MKALYVSLLIATFAANAVARPPEPDPTADAPNEGSALQFDSTNQIYHFKWWGRTGRTYFLQQSTDLMQLWNWVPVIEAGNDSIKDWGFTSTSDKCFVRLIYTDQATSNPLNDDFDGDGISNIDEVQQGSDPFDYYSRPSLTIIPILTILNGNNQSTPIDQYAPQPLTLLVTDSSSTPLNNAPVTFTAGLNAFISSEADSSTLTNSLTIRTNTQGQALAYLWFQGVPGSRTIAYNPEGHATPTGTISAQVIAGTPVVPTNLTAITNADGSVTLNWTDSSTNETGFIIERSLDNGQTWVAITTTAANATSFTDTTVPQGSTALYRIKANNQLGSSGTSNTVSQNGTDASATDTDGDGMPDAYELAHGLDSLNPYDAFEYVSSDSTTTQLEAYIKSVDHRDLTSTSINTLQAPPASNKPGDVALVSFQLVNPIGIPVPNAWIIFDGKAAELRWSKQNTGADSQDYCYLRTNNQGIITGYLVVGANTGVNSFRLSTISGN